MSEPAELSIYSCARLWRTWGLTDYIHTAITRPATFRRRWLLPYILPTDRGMGILPTPLGLIEIKPVFQDSQLT